MLRNLIDEVMRRRLWPIFVVAALVAIAAPVLFLKSAAPDAPPASTAAPAAAPAGELPARAQRLLAATGDQPGGAGRAGARKTDPFQGPSSRAATASSGATAGATTTTETPSGSTSGAGAQTDVAVPTTPASNASTATSPAQPAGDDTTTATAASTKSVDVRFGEHMDSRLNRAIPRMQTFIAGGRVVAIFVKYSPSRDKAVFAIAPKTLVSGDIDCRRKQDVCRYVDIPAGKSVRLTTLDGNGDLVTRRLDVVRIERPAETATATAASSAPADGSCLLGKLLKLTARDMPLASDACQS